LDLQSDN
jgi:hypothetical protein